MTRPELLGKELFDLHGRVAVITGAGRGLGRTMALALASAGASVVASARSAGEIESLRAEIREFGGVAEAVVADITSEESVEALMSAANGWFGHLDILVNNAGINFRKPMLELETADYMRVLDTNLKGSFLCARTAGRYMVAQGSGKIINISSILGRVALADQMAYASSKGGMEQLTKVLAVEWAPHNIQVNAIGPTYFETDLTKPLFDNPERNAFITSRTPAGRWGQPHELAGAVIFLASQASDYVTGHTLMVDGGWTAW
ncbi:2-deoxy-D-gluconate 3-dehydrogenase [bacterium SCGC AG-212-C10]|nr:2-deoxy-D-gluconate 3-dehydrogenase [bacterium SCGC AG-212-C10]